MRTSNHLRIIPVAGIFLILGLSACAPSIAPFSETAYRLATDSKVESLKLLDQAEMPFAESAKKIEELRTDLDKAYEFAKGRPRNEISTRQWEILLDPEGHLLGGFLSRWESEESLNRPFITEAKQIISAAFDTIIGLESGKIKTPE